MLRLSLTAFTALHVAISLVAIASGIVVLAKMVADRDDRATAGLFLSTTVLTSVTGFMFEFSGIAPAHIFGAFSIAALVAALHARYVRHFAGAWRPVYVVTLTFALYLNFFVLIVQAFQNLEILQLLAPTQSEPPFQIAQLVAIVAFIVSGGLALKRFRPVA